MPRIIVTTDTSKLPDNASVLLDESVRSVHIASDHAAAQLVQRLAWAIGDAEHVESAPTPPAERPAATRYRAPSRSRSLHAVSA
jgi:hypothetical protein